jgi:hypothetical protein
MRRKEMRRGEGKKGQRKVSFVFSAREGDYSTRVGGDSSPLLDPPLRQTPVRVRRLL